MGRGPLSKRQQRAAEHVSQGEAAMRPTKTTWAIKPNKWDKVSGKAAERGIFEALRVAIERLRWPKMVRNRTRELMNGSKIASNTPLRCSRPPHNGSMWP